MTNKSVCIKIVPECRKSGPVNAQDNCHAVAVSESAKIRRHMKDQRALERLSCRKSFNAAVGFLLNTVND